MDKALPVETYEQLFARLQEIVARLEQGDLALAEMLAMYQEGTRLAAACQQLIDAAELQVRELSSSNDVED